MNLLDRAIGYVSPALALRRARARLTLAHVSRQVRRYEAARPRRTADGWSARAGSANLDIGEALVRVRRVVRHLAENNPYAVRILDLWPALVVGDGITPAIADRRRREVWEAWAETTACDLEGVSDIYGLQALALRAVVQDGDCLLRRIWTPDAPGAGGLPMRIQVLEGDYLDHGRHGQRHGDNVIVLGVELTQRGQVAAYWLHQQHPADTLFGARPSVRVPAEDVILLYRRLRPGQVRGISWLHATAEDLEDLDVYAEYLMARAKLEAALAVFIETEHPESGPGQIQEAHDQGPPLESIEPGMIHRLLPGEKPDILQPTGGGDHAGFRRASLQAAAVGVGLTYDGISGDLTGANYSSLRAGKIDQRRLVSQLQWHMMVPQLCARLWTWVEAAGLAAGLWGRPTRSRGQVAWMPPGHEKIDPKKDGDAEIREIESGLVTWDQAVIARGFDPDRQLAEIAARRETARAAGVTLPGMAAAAPAPDDEKDTDEDEDKDDDDARERDLDR